MQAEIIYEKEFGIFDGGSSNPYNTNCFTIGTDVYHESEYEVTVYELLKLKVPESTQMGIKDLLNMSRLKLTMIVDGIKRINYEANIKERVIMNEAK